MCAAPVSIIIPAFNQLEYCRACVASVQRCTPEPHLLILVDNGSTDGVGEFFDGVAGASVIHSETNLGFSGGVNLGLKLAEGHAVLLNSDTLVSPGWLSALIGALESEGDIGMAGPVTNRAAGPQQIEGLLLGTQATVDAYGARLRENPNPGVMPVNRLVGFCMAIHRDALELVGLFDERFGVGNFEDDDYCTRVRQAGYRLVIAQGSFVFHHGGKTFEAMGLKGARYEALLEENRRKYEAKWDLTLPRPEAGNAKARRLCEEADEAARSGRPQDALLRLKEGIQADPDHAPAYRAMAQLLAAGGQAELAAGFHQKAQELDGGDGAPSGDGT